MSEQPIDMVVTGPYHGELIITPPNPIYVCPVHGNIGSDAFGSGTLNFTFDGVTDYFCLKCWRDWCRAHFPQAKLVVKP